MMIHLRKDAWVVQMPPSVEGRTELHDAAANGAIDVVNRLLQANADVNVADKNGTRPLHLAASKDKCGVVALLLRANADVNVVDKDGMTALHMAAAKDKCGAVALLLRANADVNIADKFGTTPLHMVVTGSSGSFLSSGTRSKIVELLLQAGAKVNSFDKDGRNPLHWCIERVDIFTRVASIMDIATKLVAFGATWDSKCDDIIAAGKAVKCAPALRICVLTWAQERAGGFPLTDVPIETIRRGPKATKTYIEQIKNSNETTFRLKLCIVGPSKAGKTSLVKSLTARKPSLEHPEDRTIGVDHFKFRFTVQEDGKTIIYEATFWDFAGQNHYHIAHSLYYSKRALYLMCIDLEAFVTAYMQADLMGHSEKQWEQLMNEFIERDVLKWVRVIFTRQPDAEFVFVATKSDVLVEFPKFAEKVQAFLKKKLAQVEGIAHEMMRELTKQGSCGGRQAEKMTLYAYQERVDERERRVHKNIEVDDPELEGSTGTGQGDVTLASTNLFDIYTRYRSAYSQVVASATGTSNQIETKSNNRVNVATVVLKHRHDKKAELLAVSCTDVNSVTKANEDIMALIKKSNRSFAMPESYSKVLNAVQEMRESARGRGRDPKVARLFSQLDSVVSSSVAKIPKLAETTCRQILQTLHDLGDVLWYEDLGITFFQKTVILEPLLLIDFVRQVINHHNKSEVLTHTEFKGLPFWINLQSNREHLTAMKKMLQKFQLVYPSQGDMKWNSDLIVPAFWNSKTPAAWLFGFEDVRLVAAVWNSDPDKPKEQVRVHWQYHFAHEFPDSLFDHLVVATHSPHMTRDAGPDWILYADDGIFACRAMVSRDPKSIDRILHLEAVLAEEANDRQVEKLWTAFDCMSSGIVAVLHRYPGLVVTSVALNNKNQRKDLESLFQCELNAWTSEWMPPAASWERYKQVVQQAAADEEDWELLF